MILKKVDIDGQISFVPISEEEAKNCLEEDLIYLNQEKVKEDKPKSSKFVDVEKILQDVENQVSGIGSIIKNKVGVFNKGNSSKKSSLIAALPFMDKKELLDLATKVINKEETRIPLVTILPFIDEKDCDELFIKLIDKQEESDVTYFAPFVSEELLDKVVDEYVDGKYQNLNMSALYPFMSSESVKKVFNYILNNNNEE